MTQRNKVRTAHARLAAIKRHRPSDQSAIAHAERDLVVARAAALTARATAMLWGEADRG